MNRLRRILRAPSRVLNRAPRWVRLVWVLVVATACAIGVGWAQDLARAQGYASGVAESARHGAAGYASGYAAGERHEERRSRGVVEVDALPPGVDRDAAAEAEAAGEAFAFLSGRPEAGCTVMLRLPAGTLIGVPDKLTGVGKGLDTSHWACDAPFSMRLPGGAAPPTAADMPRRWDAAISGGRSFAYTVGDGVRIDIARCTGFTVPLPVPPGGAAVSESVPLLSGGFCAGEPVTTVPKPR